MNYKIGGCDVSFPHQAYGVQLSFMGKVISALEKGDNALLEAPTGSGKTLSLLCSSIAWQQREHKRLEEGNIAAVAEYRAYKEQKQQQEQQQQQQHQGLPLAPAAGLPTGEGEGAHPPGNLPLQNSNPEQEQPNGVLPKWTLPDSGAGNHYIGPDAPAINSHQPKANGNNVVVAAAAPKSPESIDDAAWYEAGGFLPGEDEEQGPPQAKRAPKIYYATRTHSQIAQVVRELKRCTVQPRMAILASKQQYCVNRYAREKPNLEETCDDLVKDSKCEYFKGVGPMITNELAWKVHDIEDLGDIGREKKTCPYFLSRKWAMESDLIFGPYNYFIDPVIRRSMGIDLTNAVVIFDEAHNIEDVAREAASIDIDRHTIREVELNFDRALKYNGKPEIYGPLTAAAGTIIRWISAREAEALLVTSKAKRSKWDPYQRSWEGAAMLQELASLRFGPESVDPLWTAYELAREEDEMLAQTRNNAGKDKKEGTPMPLRVGSASLGFMSRWIQILRMLHHISDNGGRDYRLVVQRLHPMSAQASGFRGSGGGGGRNRGGRNARNNAVGYENDGEDPDEYIMVMSLWSMNPAVAFKQIAAQTHSIVLTSGTLAPLDSFASELGAEFAVRLEAPHVVNMAKQVWAGAISKSPSGMQLVAKYDQTSKERFQDELGATVLAACSHIPDGVLLFLPSYSLLDTLCNRWKASGLWSRLAQLKTIVSEPRRGGAEALQQVMQDYYSAIAAGKGGLFMAVCRGKVSEGLDFADANARGVLIVGIPFPNITDIKVKLKKSFNDVCSRTMGLLPSSVWYEQQAFRALNQAIGRCIRHRLDWGAILLIDDRFRQPKYQKSLSRWVRSAISVPGSYGEAASSLKDFFQRLQTNPPAGPPALPTTASVVAIAPPPSSTNIKPELGSNTPVGGVGGGGGGGGGQQQPLTILQMMRVKQEQQQAAAAAAAPTIPPEVHKRQEQPQQAMNGHHPPPQLAPIVAAAPIAAIPHDSFSATQIMRQIIHSEGHLIASWVHRDLARYRAYCREHVNDIDPDAEVDADGNYTQLAVVGIMDSFALLKEVMERSESQSAIEAFALQPALAVQALMTAASLTGEISVHQQQAVKDPEAVGFAQRYLHRSSGISIANVAFPMFVEKYAGLLEELAPGCLHPNLNTVTVTNNNNNGGIRNNRGPDLMNTGVQEYLVHSPHIPRAAAPPPTAAAVASIVPAQVGVEPKRQCLDPQLIYQQQEQQPQQQPQYTLDLSKVRRNDDINIDINIEGDIWSEEYAAFEDMRKPPGPLPAAGNTGVNNKSGGSSDGGKGAGKRTFHAAKHAAAAHGFDSSLPGGWQ